MQLCTNLLRNEAGCVFGGGEFPMSFTLGLMELGVGRGGGALGVEQVPG